MPGGGSGSLGRRAVTIALAFGALMAYGVGLVAPLAIAGTLAPGRRHTAVSERTQERLRVVSGGGLALAGGFLLSMWTLRATWAVFL